MDDEELRGFMRAQQDQIAAQAEQLKELASLVRAAVTTQAVVSTLTVSELWGKYAAVMKGEMKIRSWWAISSRMKPVIAHFGAMNAAGLSVADELGYRTMRLTTKTLRRGTLLTRMSYNHEMAALLGVLNWATKNDLLATNPLSRVTLKNVRRPRKTVYSEDDADLVIEAANGWLQAMILVCKDAGMRPVEILTLEWSQIDRASGFAHLRADQTKNSKARSVKLSARSLAAIAELPHGIRWVFTNPKTGNHWSYRAMNRWWQRAVKETGLQGAPGELARFYDFRGTCATNMNRAGVSLPVIKETLGHSDYKQLEMYLRINQSDIAAGAALLEQHTENLRRRGPKRAPAQGGPQVSDARKKGKGP